MSPLQALTYEDIEGVDPAYYKNLLWTLQVGGAVEVREGVNR